MSILLQFFIAYTILIWLLGWISNTIIRKINNYYKRQQFRKKMKERFGKGVFYNKRPNL